MGVLQWQRCADYQSTPSQFLFRGNHRALAEKLRKQTRMAIKEWTGSIQGADDSELGIPRTSQVIYHCTAPEAGSASGLVFVIPDFNEDADGVEFNAMRAHLANEYGLLAVTVEYHCYRSRLADGARLILSDDEFAALCKVCASQLVALSERSQLMRALQQLPAAYEFEFHIEPPNGDYQNFGVMQALDHLAVLHHLRQVEKVDFDSRNVVAMGSGHGGYLAQLIAKFGPNAIRAVLAVNSATYLPPSYLFGESTSKGAPYYYNVGKIRIFPLIHTKWQRDQSAPAGYSEARAQIRNTALGSHIASMAAGLEAASPARCAYRLSTTAQCSAQIAGDAQNQITLLARYGFNVELVADPSDAAALASTPAVLAIFDTCYPRFPTLAERPNEWQSSVAYLSGELLYCFDYDEFGCLATQMPIEKAKKPLRYY